MANFKKALTMCFGFETWASEQKAQAVPMSYGNYLLSSQYSGQNILVFDRIQADVESNCSTNCARTMPPIKICLHTINCSCQTTFLKHKTVLKLVTFYTLKFFLKNFSSKNLSSKFW